MARLSFLLSGTCIGTIALWLAVGCGATFTTERASGGGGSGGTSVGGGGGSDTGGSPATGGEGGLCASHSNCLAVVDTNDPCFSPTCSAPRAATIHEVASNPCLLLWENRHDPVPEGCGGDEDVLCPALCAVQPECVWARCRDGECTLDLGNSPQECEASDQCPELANVLSAAVQQAQECTPPVGDTQPEDGACSTKAHVKDACDCVVPVNSENARAIEKALEAYDAWSDAQCSPSEACERCQANTKSVCALDPGGAPRGICQLTD